MNRNTKALKPESIVIWCFVCKAWIPAWREAEHCPRCGNDEIQKDGD